MTGCCGWCFHQRNENSEKEQIEIPAADKSNDAEDLSAVGERGDFVLFGNPEKVFDFEQLMGASAEVLGKGTFGSTYKVSLQTGPLVVKRLKDVKVSDSQFMGMFDTIGNTNHGNLLPLKAYHCNKHEKFLVYDYMPMGSLSALLQRNRKTPLNWDTRLGIVVGVARAIAHLHSLSSHTFHGNIKPSNILLTTSFEARVSDYLPYDIVDPRPNPGSKRIGFESGVGYRALEVTSDGKVSQKADVYSFGVVILELLTGKKPIFQDESTSEKVELRGWILSVVEDELTSQIFDLDLLCFENVEEELVRLLQIAIDCTAQDPENRPSIAEVRNQVEDLANSRVRKYI